MSFLNPIWQPTPIPQRLQQAHTFQDLRDGFKEWLRNKEADDLRFMPQLVQNHNRNSQGFDPNIASATTIQVGPNMQQIVTGVAVISTITPPAGFNGFKALYSANGFSLTTGGNIATAIAVPAGEAVLLMYFPPTQTWGVIGAFFAGTLPAGSVGTSQLQNGAVTTPKIGSQAVGTGQMANAAVTTAILASGAATEGTPFTDNTTDNITPYGTPVSVVSGTVSINATSDFVNGQVTIAGSTSGIRSGDEVDYTILRGVTTIASGRLVLTLSSTTSVGANWVATLSFEDSGISGSQTYTVQLTSVNGSGVGTLTVQKTAATLLIIDHRAQ